MVSMKAILEKLVKKNEEKEHASNCRKKRSPGRPKS